MDTDTKILKSFTLVKDYNMVKHVKALAFEVHKEQKRKDGKPYTTHLTAVANNVNNRLLAWIKDKGVSWYSIQIADKHLHTQIVPFDTFRALAVCTAYSHDLKEDHLDKWESFCDSLIEHEDVGGKNAVFIIEAVKLLSRMSKEDNVIKYLDGIKTNLLAHYVKLADLEHNLSDLSAGNLRDKYHLCQNYLDTIKYGVKY